MNLFKVIFTRHTSSVACLKSFGALKNHKKLREIFNVLKISDVIGMYCSQNFCFFIKKKSRNFDAIFASV